MTGIPAYQQIDLLFKGVHDLPPPQPGWVITFPDNDLQAEMRHGELLDAEWESAQSGRSKWPHLSKARPCWIHEAEVIFGQVNRRRYWTLR